MPYIEFDSKYRTFTVMDIEHRQLIGIINRFFDEWVKSKSVDPLPYLIELADYGHFHFDSEERFMAENHATDIEAHKLIHQQLLERLAQLVQRVERGEEVSMETFQFLQHWLMNHIAGVDRNSYGLLASKR